MLSLKIITTKLDGSSESCLFSADSISHAERTEKKSTFVRLDDSWLLGALPESTSEQPFVMSEVFLYDEDRNLKQVIQVLPKSDGYIMENGKTIDTFFCYFEQ